MFGTIILGIVGLIYIGLFGTYLYLRYRDMKAVGPMPWHPAYDQAREFRVMREEAAKNNKEKVNVNIDIDSII